MNISFVKPGQIISVIPNAEADKQNILVRGKYDVTGTIQKADYQRSDLRPGDFIVITGNYFGFDSNTEGLITGFGISNAIINSRLRLENAYATIRELSDAEKYCW